MALALLWATTQDTVTPPMAQVTLRQTTAHHMALLIETASRQAVTEVVIPQITTETTTAETETMTTTVDSLIKPLTR